MACSRHSPGSGLEDAAKRPPRTRKVVSHTPWPSGLAVGLVLRPAVGTPGTDMRTLLGY